MLMLLESIVWINCVIKKTLKLNWLLNQGLSLKAYKMCNVYRPVTGLGPQGCRKVCWKGPKFFKLCLIVFNYAQQIFPGGRKVLQGGAIPPWWRAWLYIIAMFTHLLAKLYKSKHLHCPFEATTDAAVKGKIYSRCGQHVDGDRPVDRRDSVDRPHLILHWIDKIP